MLSSKPYLVRALWSWCCDAGLTPYVTVFVDDQCQVPLDYVKDGTLTLNLSPSATGRLDIGNDWVMLSARFGGVSQDIAFPMGAVIALFARENGAGMEFAYEPSVVTETPVQTAATELQTESPAGAQGGAESMRTGKPHLQRVK